MIEKFKKNYIENNRYLFIVTSIMYGLCFLFQKPHGDDVNYYMVESGLLSEIVYKVLLLTKGIYTTVTNLYVMYIINAPMVLFIVIMMLTMYLLLNSLRELLSKNHKYEWYLNAFIAFSACTYSFVDYASSGWINASTSYFIPTVFIVTSLIPIKRLLKNEPIKKIEYPLFFISTYLGADNPQGTVILLFLYLITVIYMIVNKKINPYIIVLFLLTVFDLLLVFTSKRYEVRTINETVKRFPTMGMFNLISKIELGVFTTIRWIFFGDHTIAFTAMILFSVLLFSKYKNISIRILSLLPLPICFLFKDYINSNLSINAYDLTVTEFGSSNYGLFNLESVFRIDTFIQYIIMCGLMIIIVYEIYLLIDKTEDLIIVMALLAAGFGSRMMMAFTPTVFASHLRPFIYLGYMIIISMIKIYSINIHLLNKKNANSIVILSVIGIIINLSYFFVYVYNYMGHSIFEIFR